MIPGPQPRSGEFMAPGHEEAGRVEPDVPSKGIGSNYAKDYQVVHG